MALTREQVKHFQRLMNAFTKKYLRGVKPLTVDGKEGEETRVRAESCKYYIGFGASRHAPDGKLTSKFERALKSPKARSLGARILAAGAKRRLAQRRRQRRSPGRISSSLWGGSRTVTNEILRIVGGRAPVTSRKRSQTFGNPGSDHHVSQRNADAIDFGTANNHRLKNEISRRLGGPAQLADYGSFHVVRGGKRFRVQIIAGTHGTGPHLHVGVRRA